jgi:small subunit ribosomal protein S16
LAVAIRLTRVGATKRPAYRVIAIDKRRSRDGRALEILGYYDPLTEPATVKLETDKIKAWIGKGAQPSDTVVRLMAQAEATAKAGTDAPTPKRATRGASAKPSKKAAARAKAAEAAAAEPAAAEPALDEPAAAEPADEAAAEAPAAETVPEVEAADDAAEAQATATEEAPVDDAPAAEAEPGEAPAGDVAPAGDSAEEADKA